MSDDSKLKIATALIRVLLDQLSKPVTEQNHIEKLETIRDAKKVLAGLER